MSKDADVTADLEARMRARSVPIPEDLVGGVVVYRLGYMCRLKRKGAAYIRAATGRAVVPYDITARTIHHGCRCNKEGVQTLSSVMKLLENGYTFCRNRGAAGNKR